MLVKLPNDIEIGIRKVEVRDLPFVYHSMCKQIRTHAPFDRFTAEEFRLHKATVIDTLCDRSNILMAHDASDEEILHGYIIFEEPNVCHFCYVKGQFRGYGIGRALMETAFPQFGECVIYATHKAQSFRKLQEPWKLRWNPYLC